MAFRTNKTPVLQTKSASGSVASFNTALAMPLVNGEFTIQAYQEGSGDPSPDNVRNIVPFNKLNIGKTSDLGEWFKGIYQGVYGFYDLGALNWRPYVYGGVQGFNASVSTPKQNANGICYIYNHADGDAKFNNDGIDNEWYISFNLIKIKNSAYTTAEDFKEAMQGVYLIYERATKITPTITDEQFNALLSSFHINGEVKTVALGEDVYGGSYNSVTGKKNITYDKIDLGSLSWDYIEPRKAFRSVQITFTDETQNQYSLCSEYKKYSYATFINDNTLNNAYAFGTSESYVGRLIMRDLRFDNPTDFKNSLNGVYLTYRLATPIETDLDPTPIETYDGVNNIFCDTGDTSVTCKDLDIAKRGNFREVFRLPS